MFIPFPKMSGARSQENETKTLSFAELVRGRDASVRLTDDGYLYAVDLAMVVTAKDRDHAGQVKTSKKFIANFVAENKR